jgi:hypothetical protein
VCYIHVCIQMTYIILQVYVHNTYLFNLEIFCTLYIVHCTCHFCCTYIPLTKAATITYRHISTSCFSTFHTLHNRIFLDGRRRSKISFIKFTVMQPKTMQNDAIRNHIILCFMVSLFSILLTHHCLPLAPCSMPLPARH